MRVNVNEFIEDFKTKYVCAVKYEDIEIFNDDGIFLGIFTLNRRNIVEELEGILSGSKYDENSIKEVIVNEKYLNS